MPTTCSTRRRFPTPSTTACSASCRRSRRRIRRCAAPIRRRSASAAAARGFAPVRHAVPMLSIRTETDTEPSGARPSMPACGANSAWGIRCGGRVCRRAQVRRPRDQPALRGRRAGAGGDARRRRDRRGRDAEHPHRAAIPLRLLGESAAGAGGARRGLHEPRRLRALQRKQRSPRGEAIWSIRATAPPAASASSTPAWPAPAAVLLCLRAGRVAGWTLPATHAGVLDALAAFGLPVCEHRARVCGRRGLAAFHARMRALRDTLPFDIDGVVYKVNALALQQRSASSPASRAGRWRTSIRRRRRTTVEATSRCRSAVPARSRRWRAWRRSSSAA
jgi:DNA ligase (NAD+)